MIDDSKRPLWRERPRVNRWDRKSHLVLCLGPPPSPSRQHKHKHKHKHRCDTHKQRLYGHFHHFLSPLIFMVAIKTVEKINAEKGERKKQERKFSRFLARSELSPSDESRVLTSFKWRAECTSFVPLPQWEQTIKKTSISSNLCFFLWEVDLHTNRC